MQKLSKITLTYFIMYFLLLLHYNINIGQSSKNTCGILCWDAEIIKHTHQH